MNKRVLLLGSTGKMGVALKEVFNSGYNVIGKNSKDFDALLSYLITKNGNEIYGFKSTGVGSICGIRQAEGISKGIFV